ncbi:MAG: YbaK/EbsC family protein [Nostocoides sp.]
MAAEHSANCIIVLGRRGERSTYAAVLVLATDRADINGAVRRHLDARKISFAPTEDTITRTGMEYGGITPIGLPAHWPVLLDRRVLAAGEVVIGSGLRASRLLVAAPNWPTWRVRRSSPWSGDGLQRVLSRRAAT